MLDGLLMFGNVITTRFFAALSTFQVVRGINGLALWTGIVFPDILKPMLIAHGPDLLQVIPKLNPMRPFRLKLFKISAGIILTFNAKIDSSFSGA